MFARLMGLNVISPGKLQQLMQKQPVSILDVNSQQSWLKAHVPGALPLDPMSYGESDLPADRDSTLVFYCSNFLCTKAPNAARRAKEMGYRNVYVMSAGISGWVGASLPTESGEERDASIFRR
jgi:rhodanese-related sulfurtransferase